MKIVTNGFLSATVGGVPINSAFPCDNRNLTAQGLRTVRYIVMHYTGNPKDAALANAKYFRLPGRGASAHFFVDDNAIFQSVRLSDRAWHCGTRRAYFHPTCRNTNSVAIEMCCSGDYRVSERTKENAAQLCAYLCHLLEIAPGDVDACVLRHWDVTRKQCPAQMSGADNAEWNAFRERVKAILAAGAKPLALIAQEVTEGKWGNGGERVKRLTEAGYVPAEVQKRVNALCGGGIRVQITASKLNVRAGPGTDYKKLDIFGAGLIVAIEEARPGNGASAWGRTGDGWISLDYVREVST